MEQRSITPNRIEAFKNQLIQDEKSTSTVEKYIRDVSAFAVFAEGQAVTKALAIRYKQHLLETYAPASVNSMLAAINRFFRAAGWHECAVKAVRIQRQAFRSRERELTKGEYFRLLEAARKKNDRRLFLLMQTICATGIRISELRFITAEAVRHGRATVSLKGKTRQVLLPTALCRELRRFCGERGIRSGSIFITKHGNPMDRSNILHEMKALCEAARVDRHKVFPHNLRHLFACLYYEASKDLSHLADLLGHSSINTTRIYTTVSGDRQQRQIERLGLVIEKTA